MEISQDQLLQEADYANVQRQSVYDDHTLALCHTVALNAWDRTGGKKVEPLCSSDFPASTSRNLFIVATLKTAMCHMVYPFAQTVLPVNVHCNESLVLLKASLWLLLHHQYWALTETLLRYLAVAQSHRDPATVVPQDR